jgi:predicted Abi (CAAX) family protease
MPIISNLTQCVAHGYNTSPCWVNYTLSLATNLTNYTSSSVPDPLHVVVQNLPWVGLALWVTTYLALFILFHKSGGREKFMAMGLGGFLASIVYSQGGLINVAYFTFSFLILIFSIIAYALIKDSGE